MRPSDVSPPAVLLSRALIAALALLLAAGWLTATAPRAAADGPTTFTNPTSIAIPAAGSANQTGPASPYPSTISVSGMAGSVTHVTVTFHGLTHGAVNDIDAMVVAPSGQNLVVLSDVGDPSTLAFANNATLTFDDAAAGPVPTGNIPTGSYRPTNNGSTDSFPPPTPAPSTQSTLAGAFTGITANGTWQLFVVDDATGDLGQMAGGWSLTITTEVAAVPTTTTPTTSDASSTTGDPVTFTATVRAGGSPVTAGSVQFSDGGASLGDAVPLTAAGTATLTTSALTEGTHLIRATFSGAAGFLTSNGTLTQRVDNPTTVNGNTFCNTGPITVPGLGTATPYPSNITVSGLSGQITKVTARLTGLSHQVPLDLDVLLAGPAPSQNLFLLSDAGGQSPVSNVTLVLDDAAASPVPNPMVSGTFRPTRADDESADALPAPAPSPSTATTLATFHGGSPNGTWSLWVVDDASGDSGSISGGWCLTIVSQQPTVTTLTAAPSPSTFGQPVTFTATVTSGGSPVAAGTVQFRDAGTALGAAEQVAADGTVELSTSTLAVGTHQVTADYTGAGALADSSGSMTHVVDRALTRTGLSSSLNPSTVGAPVTFTASVTSGGAPVTGGTVQFANGATALGSPVSLASDGTATLTTDTLTAGTHPISATYGGTAELADSDDDLEQVVDKIDTVTLLAASVSPSNPGQSVTFTAAVTAGGNPVTDGSVRFRDGTAALGGPITLAADGTAAFTTSALAVGPHTIVADYAGTDALAASSDDLAHEVVRGPTSTSLTSSLNPSNPGDEVTFTATVTSDAAPVATGAVQFSVDGAAVEGPVGVDASGVATFVTSALGPGLHTIGAAYGGDATYQASDSPLLSQVVNPVADAGGPYAVAEGASLTLDGAASTDGVSYAWDVNDDGAFGDADGESPTLTWSQLGALGIDDGPASLTVRLRVTLAGGGADDDAAALAVTNTAPGSVVTGALTATVGVPFTVKVGADDPSAADMAALFSYTVDWGDGSPVETLDGPADPPVTHTYTSAGDYAAAFTAADKDSDTGDPTSVQVVVSPAQTASPTPTPSPSPSPSPSPTPTDSATPSPSPTSTTPTSDAGDGGDELASTGATAALGTFLAGLTLLICGGALILASRRRRDTAGSDAHE